MAYYLPYKAQFNNQIGQFVEVEFYNTTFTDTTELVPLVSFKHEYINGNQDKFDPVLIGSRCIIELRAKHDSADAFNNETFYANAYDDWKVLAYVDAIKVFEGFITMDVEPYVLKDKPYNIVITASDGLGLLKNVPLTDVSGVDFVGRNSLLEYICGALKKTNLDLPVRICFNWYNAGQDDRYDTGSPDMLTQTTLHHRTFLENVNGFYDCYTSLERILGNWAVLFQWKGRWVISNRAELMGSGGPDQYYTEYDSNGTTPTAVFDLTGVQNVGKDLNIAPVNLDQLVSYQTPVKSVKTIYKYEVPVNIYNNEAIKELGSFISPLSGVGYAAWNLAGWTFEKNWVTGRTAATGTAYIKTEFDIYNTEVDRYYVVPNDPTGGSPDTQAFISNDNDDFWVDAGDRLSCSITHRDQINPGLIEEQICGINILVDGGDPTVSTDWYSYNSVSKEFLNGYLYTGWVSIDGSLFDLTEWNTSTFTDIVIPVSGTLYIMLKGGNVERHFKDLSITYTPYVRGSRLYAKGDYWLSEQNTNIKDVIEDEVFISDAPKRILKGALWNAAGTALTNPDWYRLATTENRHFKELVNLGRYRHQYIRQRRIEGVFKGTMVQPSSDPTNPIPLGFHRHFYIQNVDYTYVLVPPLEIDYVKGLFRGTLMACITTGTELSTDGDTHTFNYIF